MPRADIIFVMLGVRHGSGGGPAGRSMPDARYFVAWAAAGFCNGTNLARHRTIRSHGKGGITE